MGETGRRISMAKRKRSARSAVVHRGCGVGELGKKVVMAGRRSRSVGSGPRAGSVLQGSVRAGPRRRRGGRRRLGGGSGRGGGGRVLGVLVVLAAMVGGVLVWRSVADSDRGRRAAAERFATAWGRGDRAAMWRALTPRVRAVYPEARFAAAYRSADQAAGVRSLRIGAVGSEHGGRIRVAVAVGTEDFGTLRGTIALPLSRTGTGVGVDWDPSLRLPGLRRGERVHRRSGAAPPRAAILAADGTRLDATALGASVAGRAGNKPTGLERVYDSRLSGHPARAAAVRCAGHRAQPEGPWPLAADDTQAGADGAGGGCAGPAARWGGCDPPAGRCCGGACRARGVRAAAARVDVSRSSRCPRRFRTGSQRPRVPIRFSPTRRCRG